MNEAFRLSDSKAQSDRLENVVLAHRRWSDETFGDVGPVGPLKHLASEALEAAREPESPYEFADCLFLLWDALSRQKTFTPAEFLDALEAKLYINMARTWPEPKDGSAREHVRSEDV